MMLPIIEISGGGEVDIDYNFITNSLALTAGTDISLYSFFWFRAYKSIEYPEVDCDKKYFFIYSTDHDVGDGGVNLGKGDNLDLSDFVEVGTIFTGYQIETPYLIRNENAVDGEVLHLFSHTNFYDPINNSIQQTRLHTTSGGDLINSTWTDRGNPLGQETGETHTGYFKCWSSGAGYTGIHITLGGVPQDWRYSYSSDLRTWTRNGLYDILSGVPDGYKSKPSYGWFFEKYGQKWWIGTVELVTSSSPTDMDKVLALVKSNDSFELVEFVSFLNNAVGTRNYEVCIDGDTAHIYYQNPKTLLYYATWDLRQLFSI